jgi:two-component system C4-dicarboxylate transport sensor histidine kinase DctB
MDQLKSKISRSGTLSPEELQTHHERISRAIQKMVTILNTIRNMIKKDPDAKLHPIKVQDVVNESLLLLSHLQEKYSVQIVVDPGIQDLKVLGRTTEVTQVISNLIKNAIEAMVNSQQRKLMITQEIHDQEVIVSFTDTGPGVPEKMKDQIFDPLFSTKTASGGAGLGLSISRKLAQRIGGKLFLDPQQPEVGARFCISLQRY